jgi:hypothetical protein
LQVPLLFNQFNNDTSNFKLVVVALGSKNAALTDDFHESLTEIVQAFHARNVKVILMTRPLLNPTPPAPLWFNNYNPTLAKQVVQSTRKVASNMGVPCLDTWALFEALGNRWKVRPLR